MDEDIDALLEAAFDKKGVSESVLWVFAFNVIFVNIYV